MRPHLAKLGWLFVVVAGCGLAGCKQQDTADLAIRMRKGTYEQWLKQQRPVLTTLPKSAIVDYDFTTIARGTTILPVIEYDLKAGDWDGILELWFILKLDGKGKPIALQEETVTFIRLPAKKTVTGEGGKLRNQYYGLKLRRPEAAAAIKRAIEGGDFDDYRKRTDESGAFVHSLFDYNDPWKKLRKD
jgi:hypothetical protein